MTDLIISIRAFRQNKFLINTQLDSSAGNTITYGSGVAEVQTLLFLVYFKVWRRIWILSWRIHDSSKLPLCMPVNYSIILVYYSWENTIRFLSPLSINPLKVHKSK